MSRYYLDTSLFHAMLLAERTPAVVRACTSWLERAAAGEIDAVISTLTWDEVVYICGRAGKNPGQPSGYDHRRAAEAGRRLLDMRFLRLEAVDAVIVREATRLLARYPMRPRDCLHAALARERAGGRLVTLDSDFRRLDLLEGGDLHVTWIAG